MEQLTVKEGSPSIHAHSEHGSSNAARRGPRFGDLPVRDSSSSTKAPSLDGKSTTSGTTFAFDEKESLRPDDSASAKAVEEEDFYSGPLSGAPSSRVGSEAGGRAFRDQFHEISERMGPQLQRKVSNTRPTIVGIEEEDPQPNFPPLVPSLPATVNFPQPILAATGPTFQFDYQHEPDGKLFEALETPKDRLFLLKLEENIISFVRDSVYVTPPIF